MSQSNKGIFPCPSCGFLVFDEPAGSYNICPICGWEDDHVQLKYPGMRGGANGHSLFEFQKEFLKEIPVDIRIYQGFQRDPDWRPLTEAEGRIDNNQPNNGITYFFASAEDAPRYYWKK